MSNNNKIGRDKYEVLHFFFFPPEDMRNLWVEFNESRPIYAYKRFAY